MSPTHLLLFAALLVMPRVLDAQEAEPRRAVPREAVQPGAAPQDSTAQADGAAAPARRQAQPRGSRPQGDNPSTGTAVPRTARPPASPPPAARGAAPGRTVIVRPPAVYNNYYYYPRGYYYPSGYGSFGLGYFYFDPYRPYAGAYPSPAYGYRARPFSSFDIGELRLRVSPRSAHVYVDGYYAGTVNDYDGAFQALKLAPGAYRIELVAPGFDTLVFNVRIAPGQKVTYRGDLQRAP